jgi:hypothetical protein
MTAPELVVLFDGSLQQWFLECSRLRHPPEIEATGAAVVSLGILSLSLSHGLQ